MSKSRKCCSGSQCTRSEEKLRVINIGLSVFYDAIVLQGAKAVQLEWQPPAQLGKEISNLLDDLL